MKNKHIECFDKLVYFFGIPSGFILTLIRNSGTDHREWIVTLLGSYPSFIFMLGGAVIIKRLQSRLTYRMLTTLLAGAITYELSQLYMDGVFDLSDFAAIGIASLIMYGLLHAGYGKPRQKNEEKASNLDSN